MATTPTVQNGDLTSLRVDNGSAHLPVQFLSRNSVYASCAYSVLLEIALSVRQPMFSGLLRYISLLLLALSNHVLSADVAVLYEGTDFTGASWSVPVGDYQSADLNSSPVGDDAISSLTVTSGHAVLICRDSLADAGNCETFSASSASLGALSNAASSIRVFKLSGMHATVRVDQFPKDLQLYPRDTDTNTAPVTVSGVLLSLIHI